MVPFGSTVTGLATPTSDLDLVLITEWSEIDEQYFGSDWYHIAPCDTDIDDSTMEVDTSQTPPSKSYSIPVTVKMVGGTDLKGCSKEYKMALSIIGNMEDCYKIVGVATARCPIIQFMHHPSGLHCDLSVNTRYPLKELVFPNTIHPVCGYPVFYRFYIILYRLGLHNTHLLKSYLHFDPRVLPCLFILRWWIRSCGISRTQINSYCLALLLVYSLQRMDPPILPSLQSPGPWSVNMSWYSEQEINAKSTGMSDLIIDGWRAGFIDPRSLMPSSNAASLGKQ